MIDARDEVLPSAPAKGSRRTGTQQLSASRPASAKKSASHKQTLSIKRVFSDAKVNPFDQIEWDRRVAEITDDSGKTVFKQEKIGRAHV